ncbi:MAG: ROK family glucokinase [Lachnospiraceae bacterium]|nr:ROK family glucokinase [Lachnospiraceae bacterium]
MSKYIFGIDLGGTTVKCGLFDGAGTLMDKWEIPTNTAEEGKHILPDIAAAIQGKMAEKNISAGEVKGIGIDVPGPVLNERIVNKCVNLGWGVLDVAAEMESLTGISTKVCNDANAATLGEMVAGGGKGHKDLVMLTLGTGVGGGIIHDGKIIEGVNGAGGELGHMCMNPHEEDTCGCGNKGCLEQYGSATGIVKSARKALAAFEGETALKNDETLSSKAIFDAAKAGDALALSLVEEYGKLLGRAMAIISCVTDPEIFVIGGGVSKAGQPLIDVIAKYYQVYAFHASRKTEIVLATLGNDAGMYGSMGLIL